MICKKTLLLYLVVLAEGLIRELLVLNRQLLDFCLLPLRLYLLLFDLGDVIHVPGILV